jgi:hypothetical protein
MLPRPTVKYHIHPTLLLLSTPEKVALPAETPEQKGRKEKMAGEDKAKFDINLGTIP